MSEGLVLAGRYRLLTKLGEGGMGAVWRAEHLTLGTHVAIKLIDPSIANSEEALARFRREAQAAAELRSAHVVHIMDYGVENGVPYIAMELLIGESLAERLQKRRRLAPGEVAEIFTQVGRALARAHQQDIIHRDLKPDNIFLVKEGDDEIAKVLDFGIAKKIGLKATSSGVKTQTGAMLGTPYYMSPEQARAKSTIDHRTDIWSLGIIAYECLTGARPFDGATLASLLVAICTDELPTPSSVAPVPPGFDAWFARAATRDVQARFQTVGDAVAQLRQVCGAGVARLPFESTAGTGPQSRLSAASEQLSKTGDPSALTLGLGTKHNSRKIAVVAVIVATLACLGIISARMLMTPAPAASNVTASPNLPNGAASVPALRVSPPSVVAAATAGLQPSAAADSSAVQPNLTHLNEPVANAHPKLIASASKTKLPSGERPNSASPVKSDPPAPVPPKRDYDKSVGF